MHMIIIAFRNVLRHYQRNLLLASVMAFALVIITLVNAFSTGYQRHATARVIELEGGHVFISGREESASGKSIKVIRDVAKLEQALAIYDEQIAKRIARNEQFVRFILGSSEAGGKLTGVNFADEANLLKHMDLLEGTIEEVMAHDDSVILAQEIVEALQLELGERLSIYSRTITGQDNIMNFTLRGIRAQTNDYQESHMSMGYAHLARVNTLTNLPEGSYTDYILQLHDIGDADNIIFHIRRNLKAKYTRILDEGVDIDELREKYEKNVHLYEAYGFSALRHKGLKVIMEGTDFSTHSITLHLGIISRTSRVFNAIAFGLFVILLIITGVGIGTAYRMVMFERQAEIGIMRAMGVQKRDIYSIFVWEAFFISLAGIGIGLLLSLLLMAGLSLITFPQDNLFADFFHQGKLIFIPAWRYVALNATIIILLSINAVARPAKAAAQLEPAHALNR